MVERGCHSYSASNILWILCAEIFSKFLPPRIIHQSKSSTHNQTVLTHVHFLTLPTRQTE